MFKKFTNGCVLIVQKLLPDAFIFCIILTLIVFVAGVLATGQTPMQYVNHWGNGVWSLLLFSMQMALVLVLGNAFATAPLIQRGLGAIASIPKTPVQAIVVTNIVSIICCWLNWGFGLIAGALLAMEVAKRVKSVDYRLLIASSYAGFVVWHGGISGSIPLAVATWDESLKKVTGGIIDADDKVIPTEQTVFAMYNIVICIAILVVMPLVMVAMHPAKGEEITVDPKVFTNDNATEVKKARKDMTPAEKLENSMVLSMLIGALGLAYIISHFISKGVEGLNLDTINMIFLILGIILHRTPIAYIKAVSKAVSGAAGIILQFPFYAGIMGMMTGKTGDNGVSLAILISNFFVSVSTPATFPMFSFWSAGIVNFFVPSGGGQWAVQGPIMLPAAQKIGVDLGVTSMSIAWGDAWTNLLQPFWALPALGIAKLGARDIMGYCLICLIVTGVIISAGLFFLA